MDHSEGGIGRWDPLGMTSYLKGKVDKINALGGRRSDRELEWRTNWLSSQMEEELAVGFWIWAKEQVRCSLTDKHFYEELEKDIDIDSDAVVEEGKQNHERYGKDMLDTLRLRTIREEDRSSQAKKTNLDLQRRWLQQQQKTIESGFACICNSFPIYQNQGPRQTKKSEAQRAMTESFGTGWEAAVSRLKEKECRVSDTEILHQVSYKMPFLGTHLI